MSAPSRTFFHWPGWSNLGHALLLNAAMWLWFGLVYGGTSYLASIHAYRVRLHSSAELAIPLVPPAVLFYMSIYVLFCMAPFVLRTRLELQALAATVAVVTLFGGVCFLLFPSDIKFPSAGNLGRWEGLVGFARRLALTNNFAPSMHVVLSTAYIIIYARQAPAPGRVLLYLWAAAVGASTLLLHQHYVVDVLSGLLVAAAGVRWVYDRRVIVDG